VNTDPEGGPHRVQVGQLYSPTRTSWPETPHLRLSPGSCDLGLFLNEPSEEEAHEVSRGAASFAWVDGGPVSLLCFKFGSLSWMDAPFEPWLLAEDERGVPPGAPRPAAVNGPDAGHDLAEQRGEPRQLALRVLG